MSPRLRCLLHRTVYLKPDPGHARRQPANTPCVQLDERLRCKLFGSPLRPKVCGGLQPSKEMCGESRHEAMTFLIRLAALTAP